MPAKNSAQIMVEQLVSWGVKRVYGVVGDANLVFIDAINRNPAISFIQARHETAAAFMASAEAKLTGEVGVCTSTNGPGLVNMLNGMGDAYSDQVPLLAVTGQVPSNKLGLPVKQYVDEQVMVQPLARWSSQLCNPHRAAELTWLGLHYAYSQGGVSHLSVLKDIWTLQGGETIKDKPNYHTNCMLTEEELAMTVDFINNAQRPLIMVGRGIASLVDSVKVLAEKIGAPVITTLAAKGLIPEDYYLSVGGLGQAGTEAAGNLIKKADLVLILGATWWPEDYGPAQGVKIIQIDAEKKNLSLKHPAVLTLNVSLGSVISNLEGKLTGHLNGEWLKEVEGQRKRWFGLVKEERESRETPIMPQALMAQLEQVVSPESVMVLDVGDHVIWYDRCYWGHNQDLLISGNWRSMAFGLPAAIAAKLVHPARPVVCISGDGGLSMTLGELVTAVQHNTPIKLVVVNNGSLAMEENRAITAGLLTQGVTLVNPDFAGVALACGWEAVRVNKYEELPLALEKCIRSDRPFLVDIACAKPMPAHTKL